jgi:signal transduction histidine kinase
MRPILEIKLNNELDVLAARQRTRQIALLFGFTSHEQTRLSTVVSELARRATNDDLPGHISLRLSGDAGRQTFVIAIVDRVSFTALHPSVTADEVPELIAHAANQPTLRQFLDGIDLHVGKDGATVTLSKARPATAPHLSLVSIEHAVSQLSPLSSTIALSDASRQAREIRIRADSISSENVHLHRQAHVLSNADQRKDEFLAVLAHELRGPLSAVAMAADMLGKGTASAAQAVTFGQLIRRQADHMSRIVEDLLDVSRIVRNEVSIERGPVDLRDVLAAAVEQHASAAQRRSQHVAMRYADEHAIVSGDRTRLVQIVGNLIGNAIRYTQEGGHIEVALTTQPAQLCIAVTDDGIGMSADLLPTLFDMFKQARRSTDGRNSGLGLGLALVRTLAEAHGGTVRASSDGPGKGSRFEVWLPREDAHSGR